MDRYLIRRSWIAMCPLCYAVRIRFMAPSPQPVLSVFGVWHRAWHLRLWNARTEHHRWKNLRRDKHEGYTLRVWLPHLLGISFSSAFDSWEGLGTVSSQTLLIEQIVAAAPFPMIFGLIFSGTECWEGNRIECNKQRKCDFCHTTSDAFGSWF